MEDDLNGRKPLTDDELNGRRPQRNIKGNRSSRYREDMTCRYCKTEEDETQEHMEICKYTATLREWLNLNMSEIT